jgi:hypothetical protein
VAFVDLSQRKPVQPISREMLFSSRAQYVPAANWSPVQCIPICKTIEQAPNIAGTFAESLAKGFVGAAGVYVGAQLFKRLSR